MPPFSRDKPARRNVVVQVRVSESEAKLIDELARRLGLVTRSDVLRAALDALARPGKIG